MAKDDKDIDDMMRRIDSLQKNRRRHSGDQRSFAEEFAADLDRESFLRRSWSQRIKAQFVMAGNWIQQKTFLYMYGHPQPQMDGEGLMLLGILLEDGKISQKEWRRAVWQRIIRRAEDGGLDAVGPTRRSLFLGKAAVAPVIFGTSYFVVALLAEPFHFFTAAAWSFVVGCIIGSTCKRIYDCAWGHRELAKKLGYLCPFFRLRLSQRESV